MYRSSLLALLALITTFFALGATAGAATLLAPEYSGDTVYEFTAPDDGTLTAVAGSPFSVASGGTTAFVPSPDGKFGFAAYLFSGGVRPFTISDAGVIAPASSKLGSSEANDAAISPNGKYFYVATRDPGSGVRAWSIAADGTLSAVSGSPFAAGTQIGDVVLTPDGKRLYASTGSKIARFDVNADGTLTPQTDFTLAGASRLVVASSGRFLVVQVESGGGDQLRSLAIAADGSLSQVGDPFPTGNVASQVPTISNDGRFVYLCDSNADQLFALSLNPDGTLGLIGAPIEFQDCAALLPSNDGRRLYAVHYSSEPYGIFSATIGADGRPGPFTFRAVYSPVEPVRLSFLPGQGTTAAATSSLALKPLTFKFDASGSTAAKGAVSTYDWDFGDGLASSTATATTTHTFAAPGKYNVALTPRDSEGCAGSVFDGHYMRCNGTAAGTKTLQIDTPPWITSLKVSPSTVSSKTKIKFKLTEAATVTFVVQKPTVGRTVGGKCVKQTSKNKKLKKCTRWRTASKKFTAKGKAGKTNSLKFSGTVKRKKLAKGSYRIYATAKDGAKGVGPVAMAKFKVKR